MLFNTSIVQADVTDNLSTSIVNVLTGIEEHLKTIADLSAESSNNGGAGTVVNKVIGVNLRGKLVDSGSISTSIIQNWEGTRYPQLDKVFTVSSNEGGCLYVSSYCNTMYISVDDQPEVPEFMFDGISSGGAKSSDTTNYVDTSNAYAPITGAHTNYNLKYTIKIDFEQNVKVSQKAVWNSDYNELSKTPNGFYYMLYEY